MEWVGSGRVGSARCRITCLFHALTKGENLNTVDTKDFAPAPKPALGIALRLSSDAQKIAALVAYQDLILKALDTTTDAIYLVDRASMAIIYANDAACRLSDMSREQLIAAGPAGALGVPNPQIEKVFDGIIARGVPSEPVEIMRPRKDGKIGCYELRRHPVHVGGRWLIVSLAQDITEAKQSQTRITHLNRVYAMLGGINALIVRARTLKELFEAACRIAGKEGGFPMTMIAMQDPETRKLAPVATFGMAEEVVDGLTKRFASTQTPASGPRQVHTMAERAILEKHAVLNNDLVADPSAIYAARYLKSGIRAMAMLPLIVRDEAASVLALYSTQVNFFRDEELKLLLTQRRHCRQPPGGVLAGRGSFQEHQRQPGPGRGRRPVKAGGAMDHPHRGRQQPNPGGNRFDSRCRALGAAPGALRLSAVAGLQAQRRGSRGGNRRTGAPSAPFGLRRNAGVFDQQGPAP